MIIRWLPALALVLAPSIVRAQSSVSDAPVVTGTITATVAAPALPPPPPGAGPEGPPPPPPVPAPGYPNAAPGYQLRPPPPVYAPPSYPPQQITPGYAQPAYPPPPGYAQPAYPPQPAYGQPAYSPGYGATQYYPQRMFQRRIVDYHGGPVPPGARLETRRSAALMITGGVVFALAYAVSILDSSCAYSSSCSGQWLYVPMAGPFIALGIGPHSATDQALLVVDGILQIGGVAAFVAGMLVTHQVLVYVDYANDAHRPPARRAEWMLTPGAPGAALGATLSLARF